MLPLPQALQIALRFSRARRRTKMISLVSILSTIGITLGVAVLIIGLSAMNGFERELNQRILNVVPQGEIQPVEPPFNNWQSLIPQIEQVAGVAAAAPYIQFNGLVEKGAKLQAAQLRGVDPTSESRLSSLPQFVLNHAWNDFKAGQQQIILGSGLAKELNIQAGDWISILIPSTNSQMQLLSPKRIRVQVSGILQLSGQLDHHFALIPLADAQQYLNMPHDVSGIAVKMQDPFAADKIIRAAGEATHSYVYIHSWLQSYGYMYRDIQMIRIIMYLAMALVIAVACFNIISTLIMAVKDKRTDIAILYTLGARDRLIKQIFIWYGLLTGTVGSLLGCVIGIITSLNLTSWVNQIEKLTGHTLLSGDIYFINFLPAELKISNVLTVFAMALFLCFLASWYPARRASRIEPARILSGL